jgi:hypothetical protein
MTEMVVRSGSEREEKDKESVGYGIKWMLKFYFA